MSRLGLVLLALVLGRPGLTPAQDDKTPPTKEKVLSQLQGQWKLRWSEQEGRREDADGTAIVTIKGDRWMIGKREVAIIDIDPSTSPMVIDLRLKQDLAEADKGQTLEGIFKIEGGRLTCCFSRSRGRSDKQRPAEFSSKADARLVLHEFEHLKP